MQDVLDEHPLNDNYGIDTFNAAAKRFPLNEAILHSDRGSQYTSETFRETLSNAGVLQSLSGVNHCFDNAQNGKLLCNH